MSAKFTPGPWKRDGIFVSADAGLIAKVFYDDSSFEQARANAALMAEAPFLYAALQALIARCERELADPEDVHELNAARAALSRASGQKKGEAE